MPKTIRFHKMHGIGNDFMLIDTRQQNFIPSKTLIQSWSNRHTGIGFDQLIMIGDTDLSKCDAAYRFFNPDGSEAEQCGNGQRCISLYLHSLQPNKSQFCVAGLAGLIHSQVLDEASVSINMGTVTSLKTINTDENPGYQVDFGNPHLVYVVENITSIDLAQMHHQCSQNYTDGINLEVAQIIDDGTIKLRVFERGTGETLACGSGACAAVAALQQAKKLSNKVKVMLPGGLLVVEYSQHDNCYYLIGAAASVYTGEINL